jgi:hypothetical protein
MLLWGLTNIPWDYSIYTFHGLCKPVMGLFKLVFMITGQQKTLLNMEVTVEEKGIIIRK